MKKVEIKSGEFRFVGKLLTEEAPETCRVFENMLPLKSQFIHVRWSGEGIWIPYGDLRTGLDYENHTSHPAKGEMLLYPGGISEMEIIMSSCFLASSSKTRINSAPMILRFFSGSATPDSFERKRSTAST